MSLYSTGSPAGDAAVGLMIVLTGSGLFLLAMVCWDGTVHLFKTRRK